MFLPRVEGGRYVDIRLQGDAYQEDSQKRDAVAGAGAPAAQDAAGAALRLCAATAGR